MTPSERWPVRFDAPCPVHTCGVTATWLSRPSHAQIGAGYTTSLQYRVVCPVCGDSGEPAEPAKAA